MASSTPVVAIDTETTGTIGVRDGRDFALGVSIAWGDTAFYLPFRHSQPEDNYSLNQFRGILQEILDGFAIIYHNAKFDIPSLATLGLDAKSGFFYDTMILAHLVDEERPYAGKSLNACVAHYCSNLEPKKMTPELKLMIKAIGWADLPSEQLCDYATWDAYLTLKLYEALKPHLSREKLGPVWRHKMNFMKLVIDMEKAGVLIDQDKCIEQVAIGRMVMDDIVDTLCGLVPSRPTDLRALLVDQLGLPTIISRKTGNPTFDKDAMEQYEQVLSRIDNPTARLVLQYRGWQKAVTSNYEPYLALVSPDGRLRPSYKHHGTRTGRLSCEMPNLQQIPRSSDKAWNGNLKGCFIAKEGSTLIEVDYSQLELRLGTAYAGVDSLKSIFNEGRDVFTEMAEQLGMARQDVKTLVYSMQYGAGVNRVSFVFGLSEAAARERIDDYFSNYPGFKIAKNRAQQLAMRDGKVALWSGRFRHFANRQQSAFKAFNSIIQGGAADIVESTMLRLRDEGFDTPDCKILLQVHDSVVFEIRNDLLEETVPAIKECMVNVKPDFGVKFAVEAKKWGK